MIEILLADDEYLVREALKMILKEIENVTVIREASSGEEALKFIISNDPEIILLDLEIPGISIQNFMTKIRDYNRKSLVFLIGYESTQSFHMVTELGAACLIGKPLNRKRIIEAINYCVPHRRDLEKITESKSIHGKKEIKSALDYIEKNFDKGLTLEDVAKYVHLSPFYLSKLFKKVLNVNFVSYVTERKIDKAKELLQSTDMPVLNIALELNYQEPNYFSKVFKKVTGMTPSDFRKISEKNDHEILKRHHHIQNGKWHI